MIKDGQSEDSSPLTKRRRLSTSTNENENTNTNKSQRIIRKEFGSTCIRIAKRGPRKAKCNTKKNVANNCQSTQSTAWNATTTATTTKTTKATTTVECTLYKNGVMENKNLDKICDEIFGSINLCVNIFEFLRMKDKIVWRRVNKYFNTQFEFCYSLENNNQLFFNYGFAFIKNQITNEFCDIKRLGYWFTQSLNHHENQLGEVSIIVKNNISNDDLHSSIHTSPLKSNHLFEIDGYTTSPQKRQSNAKNCGNFTDAQNKTMIDIARKYGYTLVCAESLQVAVNNKMTNQTLYGGAWWNIPERFNDTSGLQCSESDSIDAAYMKNVDVLIFVVATDAPNYAKLFILLIFCCF